MPRQVYKELCPYTKNYTIMIPNKKTAPNAVHRRQLNTSPGHAPFIRTFRDQIAISLEPLRSQWCHELFDSIDRTRREVGETQRAFITFILHPFRPNIIPGPHLSPTLSSNRPHSPNPFHRTAQAVKQVEVNVSNK